MALYVHRVSFALTLCFPSVAVVFFCSFFLPFFSFLPLFIVFHQQRMPCSGKNPEDAVSRRGRASPAAILPATKSLRHILRRSIETAAPTATRVVPAARFRARVPLKNHTLYFSPVFLLFWHLRPDEAKQDKVMGEGTTRAYLGTRQPSCRRGQPSRERRQGRRPPLWRLAS